MDISVNFNPADNYGYMYEKLKEIGFDAISPEWKKDAKIDELVKTARE